MISPIHFQRKLEERAGDKKLQLKINDNRSTMLSVRWEPDLTVVSLHRMFLEAPKNVMQSLACYLKQEDENIAPCIKYFIEENIKKLDYSQQLNRRKLYTQGAVYNLKAIYEELNKEYFDQELDLLITWFGKSNCRNRTRITFGLYHDPLRLIKINRMMDTPSFPDYVISYIIYHEMLHHVCPSYHDERGIHRIHSKEFKERETEFHHYELANNWIKRHHEYLFRTL